MEAQATAKYVRTSAQKAGLVLDLIRGRGVSQATATLKFSRKRVARAIEKVLRSAVANAQQKDGFGGDVDQLYVRACYANQGPSLKRIRAAPMGRAFRVLKRSTHVTIEVAERAAVVRRSTAPPSTARPPRKGAPPRKRTTTPRSSTGRGARTKKADA
ncbi:MAG: 50S ribosomal protein L22 [Luteitalea sp.]|nr:50S ribosomal protein L22 [Luteitalea sp.]